MYSLNICMLGEFSISLGGQTISDRDNRSNRIWLLLAYLAYHRTRPVTQQELLDLFWGDGDDSSNPANALKTMFHRARAALDGLGEGCGRQLIRHQRGVYQFAPEDEVHLDLDQFEALSTKAHTAGEEEEQLALLLDAIALYQGDFLAKLSADLWVTPLNIYYHNQYVQSVYTAASLLQSRDRFEEMEAICRHALSIDPSDEQLYYLMMQALLAQNKCEAVASLYNELSEMLYSEFGVLPSDDIRALYRQATKSTNDRELDLSVIIQRLNEPLDTPGAFFCDYDFFRALFQVERRSLARSGNTVHLGLLSVASGKEEPLSRRSVNCCMANLMELMLPSLRRGDVVTRYSASQYLVMLPQANYDDSCMVMNRIIKAFQRRYPHSPARLHASVLPLTPN